jgi:hypothetical protein
MKRILAFSLLVVSSVSMAQNAPVGAGIDGIADWSSTHPFGNLVKQSRKWGTPNTPWDGNIPVDAAGWPTTDFGAVLMVDQSKVTGLGGVYKIEGQANQAPTITNPASSGAISNFVYNPTTKIFTADYTFPAGGSQIMLGFSNTGGGVRNLRVMRPGYSSGTFTRPFLDHIRRFRLLRFMDWTHTNGNTTVRWRDRSLPSTPSWAAHPGGVPWDHIIELSNLTGSDIWINVPHRADNDYVRNLATLMRDRLRPERKVYVEYSNEVWNWGFEQATWNLNKAKEEVQLNQAPYNFDNVNNDGYWAARRVGWRLKQIRDIFADVFGANRMASQIRPVLAYQIVWPGLWLDEPLKMIQQFHGNPGNSFYGIAGAPYFNLGDANNNNALTLTQVLDALDASINTMPDWGKLEYATSTATWNGMRFVAYEGGPDTFGPNSIAAKRDANYSPRMKTLCESYLRTWFQHGGEEFQWFVCGAGTWESQYGTWTLTEDILRDNTPKTQAIDAIRLAPKPAVTVGQPVPGLLDTRRFVDENMVNWAARSAEITLRNPDDFRGYLLRVPTAGTYRFSLMAATDRADAIANWMVNNSGVNVAMRIPTSATYRATGTVSLPLRAGLNVVRVRAARNAEFRFNRISVLSP